ncbi:UNVERIFIED_CONTAM: hypothetical protein Sindi_2876400 [Sesamum indicum]
MAMRKLQHKHVPIWIKLRHLPMEYWTIDGLSTVASGVGRPLYPDAITRACTRLDFARVCVMIDVTQTLPKHIIVMTPDENGGETPCKVDVEYEWLPPKCTNCMILGHMTKDCPLNKIHKPSKPPVAVYVAKTNTPLPQPNNENSRKPMRQTMVNPRGVLTQAAPLIMIHVEPSSVERPWAEQTRPSACIKGPCLRIQSYLLPQWNWFTDYNSIGNRIWLAWDENFIDTHVLDLGDQFVHCRITSRAVNETVFVTIVYGATEVIDRRNLWTTVETLALQCSDIPWLVGGDFNAVRELNEVCGISGDIRMATEEFNTRILEAGLIPLPMQGEWFTWYNCSTTARSLWKRLDRILINDRWLARFPTSSYHSLTPRTSDHSPLVLQGDTQQHNGGGMFRFDNYLARSPDFIPNVQNIWHHEVVGIPMSAVTRKLKALKPVFRLQRRNKGDLTLNVQLAKSFLDEAQQLVSSDRQNELYLLLEHCCRIIYAKAAKLEQIMLQQRAKMQWMKDGDQCFPGFLSPWARHCITDEEASHLLLPFSPDDVKQALFDIAEDKAPGPDGYSSGFFKAAWPVVGEEVTRAVLDFFTTGKLLKQINSTILTLIPKTRLLAPIRQLFILGRSIGDKHYASQELFSGYNQMRLPPRCALKVDIRKAYDTVEWDFLLAVLQLFGFPKLNSQGGSRSVFSTTSFLDWSQWKTSMGSLLEQRGLRQGDPLSPYLFVLVMEALHLGFLQRIEQDMQFTYHLKCESSKLTLTPLEYSRRDWNGFAELSGLWLNVQKSHLIISRSAQELKDQMLEILGFQEGHLPMRYLGLPLISSRLSISDCQPLISKIDARITGWEGISLSYVGRVQIIKSVLSRLSLYWASAFILPKKVIKEIEKRVEGISYGRVQRLAATQSVTGHPSGSNGYTKTGYGTHQFGLSVNMEVLGGWRKILRLRSFLRSIVDYQIGNGGEWQWPTITDFECLEITHNLPLILGGEDRVIWRCDEGQPTTQTLYRLFDPPEPKLGWSSLVSGLLEDFLVIHSSYGSQSSANYLPRTNHDYPTWGYAYYGFVFTGPTGIGPTDIEWGDAEMER